MPARQEQNAGLHLLVAANRRIGTEHFPVVGLDTPNPFRQRFPVDGDWQP